MSQWDSGAYRFFSVLTLRDLKATTISDLLVPSARFAVLLFYLDSSLCRDASQPTQGRETERTLVAQAVHPFMLFNAAPTFIQDMPRTVLSASDSYYQALVVTAIFPVILRCLLTALFFVVLRDRFIVKSSAKRTLRDTTLLSEATSDSFGNATARSVMPVLPVPPIIKSMPGDASVCTDHQAEQDENVDIEFEWTGSLMSFFLSNPEPADGARHQPPCANVPVTLIGTVRQAWEVMLPFLAPELRCAAAELPDGRDLPIELLLSAIETQSKASAQLGTFMMLQVKCDESNVRTIRKAWERHGKPAGVRQLFELEKAAGVQQSDRLEEGSAALALLWCVRMKAFWVIMARGLADADSVLDKRGLAVCALEAYEQEVEPFHGWVLSKIHRTAMGALPSRAYFLKEMARDPHKKPQQQQQPLAKALTPAEREAVCIADIATCADATEQCVEHIKWMMADLSLSDPRRIDFQFGVI